MSIKDEAFEVLKKKAVQLYKVDPAAVTPATRFKEDLKAKSVHVVQFSAVLEDEFELEVPFMEFANKPTLGDIAAWIAEELGE